MIKNSKLKNLHLKRTHFLKSIIDRITNTIKISIKKKFLNWKRIAIPVEEKKDFVKIINSFTKVKYII